MRIRRSFTALVLSGASALTLGACGSTSSPDTATGTAGDSGAAPAGDSSGSGGAGPVAGAGPGTITMEGTAFTPTTVNVEHGATIKIVNKDTTVHDVLDAKDGIKSGDVKANGTGTVTAPAKAGSYAFICTHHPNMKATLVVS